jgi:GDP/UDP-N,N'-diacetylbacillosamine 2-epimerase (hydrolysing)
MNIGVLTSSRADFGIYLPLLKKIKEDSFFNLEIIAFGTHLSEKYGLTKTTILDSGFTIKHELETTPNEDTEEAISKSIGETIIKFATFWANNKNTYDLVLCLGDRYEMFAAVTAGIAFNINFAHIHAGEKTLGAIDNIFRHSITFASKLHFTSTEEYKTRVLEMLDTEHKNVTNVGALSLDTLSDFVPLTREEFKNKWGVDFSIPTVLTTFHPETVANSLNKEYAEIISDIILKYTNSGVQFLITMPNADTSGSIIRKIFEEKLGHNSNIFLLENLGTKGYFSAMKHCKFLLGNTSSGIIEAASFQKYVINVGDRQKGRASGANIINADISFEELSNVIDKVMLLNNWEGNNIYFIGNAAENIIYSIKNI